MISSLHLLCSILQWLVLAMMTMITMAFCYAQCLMLPMDHDDDDIDSSSSCCAQCLLLGLEPFGKMSHAPLLSPSLGCYIINIIIIIIVIIPIVIIIIITTLIAIFTRGAFSSRQLFLLNSGFFIFPPLLLMKESR